MTCPPPVPPCPRKPYRRLRITELRGGDTATVLEIFKGLSPRSRFLRFHTGQPQLSRRMLRRLTDIEQDRHVAHVALLGPRPVGLVRWIRFPAATDTAELAVEVVDDAHGHGIGRALIGVAAQSAQRAGVRDFTAFVAPGNHAILQWARGRGAVTDPDDSDVLHLPVAALLPARWPRPVLVRWPLPGHGAGCAVAVSAVAVPEAEPGSPAAVSTEADEAPPASAFRRRRRFFNPSAGRSTSNQLVTASGSVATVDTTQNPAMPRSSPPRVATVCCTGKASMSMP